MSQPSFREYPKWVRPDDGREPFIVHSAEHEAAALPPPSVPTNDKATTDKAALRRDAESLGIEVDGRWSVERIQTAIDTHLAKDGQETTDV
jgi:hypothetical protein